MTEREAYVAFNLTDRIGSVGVEELSGKYGGVVAAWEHQGADVKWQREFDLAKRYGVTILTPVDEDYPEMLKNTRGHPLVLYVKGNVKALSKPSVSIVGTRRATAYGLDQANRLAHDLASHGWSIVSGLALGIDAESHRGALEADGTTVGVLGSALDQFYPDQNRELAREMCKKGGAVISEFSFGRGPDTQTFPQRNRIVAALSRGVVAIEAPVKSGTLITTELAGDMGRIVMALPGRVDSRMSAGCLSLIRNGATLIRCADDVEEALGSLGIRNREQGIGNREQVIGNSEEGIGNREEVRPVMTVEEAMVMRHVNAEGVTIDKLVDLTGLDAGKVSMLAMALRMKGVARFLSGNRLALPRNA